MASILLMAIGLAVVVALLGSVTFYFLTPTNEQGLSPLEQKCQEIANEGYRMHTLYPESTPNDLPESDRERLLYLDDLWMKDCVAALPHDSIINIANNVERNFSHGE